MAYELRDGQGTLWQNRYKQAGDNKPGLTGTCLIDGVEYEISAWKKQGKNGKPWFYSISIKVAGESRQGRPRGRPQQEAPQPQQRSMASDWDPDGDIPF